MATGDQAEILFVSTEHFLSLICHTCWQCWQQHVLRPVSLSKDSSSSKRATAESVWLHVSPTKSPAKFCLWNSRGWRWSEKQEKGSFVFRSQLEAAGLRVRGSVSWLINGGIYGMDVIGMAWLWEGTVTFLLQTVQNSSTHEVYFFVHSYSHRTCERKQWHRNRRHAVSLTPGLFPIHSECKDACGQDPSCNLRSTDIPLSIRVGRKEKHMPINYCVDAWENQCEMIRLIPDFVNRVNDTIQPTESHMPLTTALMNKSPHFLMHDDFIFWEILTSAKHLCEGTACTKTITSLRKGTFYVCFLNNTSISKWWSYLISICKVFLRLWNLSIVTIWCW